MTKTRLGTALAVEGPGFHKSAKERGVRQCFARNNTMHNVAERLPAPQHLVLEVERARPSKSRYRYRFIFPSCAPPPPSYKKSHLRAPLFRCQVGPPHSNTAAQDLSTLDIRVNHKPSIAGEDHDSRPLRSPRHAFASREAPPVLPVACQS